MGALHVSKYCTVRNYEKKHAARIPVDPSTHPSQSVKLLVGHCYLAPVIIALYNTLPYFPTLDVPILGTREPMFVSFGMP